MRLRRVAKRHRLCGALSPADCQIAQYGLNSSPHFFSETSCSLRGIETPVLGSRASIAANLLDRVNLEDSP